MAQATSTSTRGSSEKTPPTPKRRRVHGSSGVDDEGPLEVMSDYFSASWGMGANSSAAFPRPRKSLSTNGQTSSFRGQPDGAPAVSSRSSKDKRDRRKARAPKHFADVGISGRDGSGDARSCYHSGGDTCLSGRHDWARGYEAAPPGADDCGSPRFIADRGAWMKSMKLRSSLAAFPAAADHVTPRHHAVFQPVCASSTPEAPVFRIPLGPRSAPLRGWVHSALAGDDSVCDARRACKDAARGEGGGAQGAPGSGRGCAAAWIHARANRLARRRHSGPRPPLTAAPDGPALGSWNALLPFIEPGYAAGFDTFDSFDGDESWDAAAARLAPAASADALRRDISREFMAGVSLGFPASLLFGDRDFTANDYEMLCRLDCAVDSRKAASRAEIEGMGGTAVYAELTPLQRSAMPRCVICLEWFRAGDPIRKLPCQHVYHQGCIDQWLGTKASCPICQHCCKRR